MDTRSGKSSSEPSRTEWWQRIFDDKYLDIYLEGLTAEKTSAEVDFVVRVASLKEEEAILDLACGHGRHAIELAKRGFKNVVGLDYSNTFLAKAKSDAAQASVETSFIRGDMKNLPFEAEFDVVLLLATAFGYFSHPDNIAVLRQVERTLRPRGRFFLDVISGEAVTKRFRERGELDSSVAQPRITSRVEMGGRLIDETEWFDPKELVIHNHREWSDGSGENQYDYWLHVYTLPQYKSMLSAAGFRISGTWGDYQGRPFGSEGTFRTLLLAEKM